MSLNLADSKNSKKHDINYAFPALEFAPTIASLMDNKNIVKLVDNMVLALQNFLLIKNMVYINIYVQTDIMNHSLVSFHFPNYLL